MKWFEKNHNLFDKNEMKKISASFYHTNTIDDNMHNMGRVDIRTTKRWLLLLSSDGKMETVVEHICCVCFQIIMINAYVLYKNYMILHDKEPMLHY